VNLTAREFQRPTLANEIAAMLTATGLAPSWLSLEITESLAMDNAEATVNTLVALRQLGVLVAIDDFGTGYSSLAYLRQFPVDILKIDQAFVQAAVSKKPGGDALIRAIVDLAANLTLTTIAEGLETKLHAEHISSLGCQMGQGYLFSRPEPAHQLERHFSSEPGSRVLTPAAY
ncbi:MAG: EAL domain-containing protein, partial [Acidimicrobiales bacterium]|nr:EAL domain-containing protein [Acidimicrobiales bacterium]